MSGSRIAEIVDKTAAVAGGIAGVRAVFGSGQGATDDPLRPGRKIDPAPSADRVGDLSHISFLPDAPGIEPIDQDGGIEIVWRIPMQLTLGRTELAKARAVALPFYADYIAAFWGDRTLGGLCAMSRIVLFDIANEGQDRWLQVDLEVREEVGL